jgi:hypothetical protein
VRAREPGTLKVAVGSAVNGRVQVAGDDECAPVVRCEQRVRVHLGAPRTVTLGVGRRGGDGATIRTRAPPTSSTALAIRNESSESMPISTGSVLV